MVDNDKIKVSSGYSDTRGDELRISIEEYCKLANKFASQNMFTEALELYIRAIQIYPNELFLKINYRKFLDSKVKFEREFWHKHETKIQKLRRNDDTMCNHYIGLGDLYLKQRRMSKSIEAYEFAKYKNAYYFVPYLKLGEIYFSQKSYEEAIHELLIAKALNKFEEKIYFLLGKIYLYKKEFEKALANFVDASILSGRHFKETPYQHEIKISYDQSRTKNNLTINEYVHSRSAVFSKLMDIINRQKGKDIENIGADHIREIIDRFKEKQFQEALIEKAEKLRKCLLVQELSEAELYRIGMITNEMELEKGAIIFKELDPGGQLYLLDEGSVKIVRMLGVGERNLAEFHSGSYFGEMDFIDNLNRSTDAITLSRSRIFSIERDDLIKLFDSDRKIAVKIMIVFWKTLALRIRDANEMLKSFFNETQSETDKVEEDEVVQRDRSINVDMKEKIDLFREKGLSEKDLKVLAALTEEVEYHKDEIVFSEGDEGSTLYFILKGKVRICKNIPGVGEEALAIMDKGDFFGEMSLIDSMKRSADVIAHEDSVTLLSISKQKLDKILFSEIETAYQFLNILCRSLSRRLRKINDMICSWHVMSGGF